MVKLSGMNMLQKRFCLVTPSSPMAKKRSFPNKNIVEKRGESVQAVFYETLYDDKTWFFRRSSNTSLFLINIALPSFTITSAGLKRLLKLLLISKP